jgi:hypothetical protein
MPTPPSVVTAIRWQEICPWLILVRAARVALLFRVIALALIGVVLTQFGWAVLEKIVLDETKTPPLTQLIAPTTARIRFSGPAPTPAAAVAIEGVNLSITAQAYGGPLYRGWTWAMQPLMRLADHSGWRGCLGLSLAGLWSIAVWALFGGAIARIAAIHLTYGETIGPLAALRESAAKWPSTLGAPLLCLAAVAIISVPLIIAGLLMRLSFLAFLIGLGWFVVLLFGIALAITLVGLALGWPLMWSTIAAERSDAFDAVSRAYAYVFQRPLHALFYVIVAGVLGLLAQAAVTLMVDATLVATDWAVELGAGEDRIEQVTADPLELIRIRKNAESINGVEVSLRERSETSDQRGLDRGANQLIRFWSLGFHGIADAFCMAYLWPAGVGIYLLLRRHIDATDLGDAVFDDGPPERGLPPLVNDPATGVPRVEEPPTAPPTDQPPAS